MVDRAKEVGLFEGVQVGRDKVSVTHLQFADDTIFFSEGDESQMVNLYSVVRLFGVLSGLRVNLEKSRVAGINVDSSLIQRVAELLGCGIKTFPMKYLGLLLGGNRRGEVFWNPVVEKIGKRLERWSRVYYLGEVNGRDSQVVTRGTRRAPWKSIFQIYPVWSQFISVRVGNGEKVKFWEDVWAGSSSLAEFYPLLYSVSQSHYVSVASVAGSLVALFSWNFNFCRNLHDREVPELVSLLSRLENVFFVSNIGG
ncbi:uncharacterized protein LOC114297657 [Camellia sinensis]|uniref:uncharacterized protein LOC114297657 n=1 Tax=Camellia sinensis TaxID=4442 RepID=UPI001035E0E9|nr:uncharacterized protein LOC114297657 [Camellia sinensis]